MGNPHTTYPILHVGGTNGKGSVAATLASVLQRAGHRVGLYTSPHLLSFRERIQVGGCLVKEADLLASAGSLWSALEQEGCSFFEAATVLALTVFRDAQVDVGVVEVGLGGRLDSTNVVTPVVTGISNVAMDHRDYLGDTLGAIAGEKAGILKRDVPAVTAEVDLEVLRVFKRRAQQVGAPLLVVPSGEPSEVSLGIEATSFLLNETRWGPLHLRTPLVGLHQARNATLAVRMLEKLPDSIRPEATAVAEGISGTVWPGRVQVLRRSGKTWVFDVAHNVAGVTALTQTLNSVEIQRPLVLLIGILGDKDWRSMLPRLFDVADGVVLTQPQTAPPGRQWDPTTAALHSGSETAVEIVPDFTAAMRRARDWSGDGAVVVTGSVHTVGDALAELGVDPFPGC